MNKEFVGMRGISKGTFEFYGAFTVTDNGGLPLSLVYPYGSAYKERILTTPDKSFLFHDKTETTPPLFGMNKFPAGSAKAITVTEGEDDAMAVYEMMGKYPAVSVANGAAGALTSCKKGFDYLNSFDKIYLCFDNDQPGREAVDKVARLFNPNKVHVVQLTKHKDARDYLLSKDTTEFSKAWWAARKFIPRQILGSLGEMKQVLMRDPVKSFASYPFPTLQKMTYGIRPREITLFLAPEKIGKTEIFRAIEYHIIKNFKDINVGIIHLEENEQRTLQGLLTYESKVPVHLPDSSIGKEDQCAILERLLVRDDRLYVYSHFGSDDPNVILDHIRLMVTVLGCKVIFLDHLSMLVSGIETEDERRKLDFLSTRLAMMVNELDFHLFMISHVNAQGEPRGSKAPSQLANTIISLHRDKENNNDDERNTTYLTLRGNRFGANTGPAGQLKFDLETFILNEKEQVVGDFNPGF
jgi:twinkle protein